MCWLLAGYLLLSNMDAWSWHKESVQQCQCLFHWIISNTIDKMRKKKRFISCFCCSAITLKQKVFVGLSGNGITSMWSDEASRNCIKYNVVCITLKFFPHAAQQRKEVNLGTSSQSVVALSYPGSEAWSEFILGSREMECRVSHGSEGRDILHQSFHSENEGGRFKKARGAKQRLAIREGTWVIEKWTDVQ